MNYNNGILSEEMVGPCADFRLGEDDLQAFDFIRKFRLDTLHLRYPGVSRVRGSNRLQVAYRLERDCDLVLPTREIFPFGLPAQFSFISTFRTRKITKSPWHILRITDLQNKPQFVVNLNPRREAVELSLVDFDGNLQTLVFTKAQAEMICRRVLAVVISVAVAVDESTLEWSLLQRPWPWPILGKSTGKCHSRRSWLSTRD
ncbi:hypothetical protein J6590_042267 [Homalodisca vitripennis]|nr:hypothetical protein J6590_042267 [Homalodisca vitripennis]